MSDPDLAQMVNELLASAKRDRNMLLIMSARISEQSKLIVKLRGELNELKDRTDQSSK